MALPDFTMRQLLEAGVHFGHQKHRWNPRMGQYIFGVRNDVHIMDLSQTVPLLHQALKAVSTPSLVAAASCSSAPSARLRKPLQRLPATPRSTSSTPAGSAAC
jgi:hypothetical protein